MIRMTLASLALIAMWNAACAQTREGPTTSPDDGETALMERLRSAGPEGVLALATEGDRLYPGSAFAEERDARRVDALVALDRLGEAHFEAMRFIQHHPSDALSSHVMNLMGVHRRPAGAVPEAPLGATNER